MLAGSLIRAVENNDTGLVDAVLQCSSEPKVLINMVTSHSPQVSALMVACMRGLKPMIKHLIAKGADVNLVSPEYPLCCNALMKAVQANKLNIVKLLIEKYDAQVGLKRGKSALMMACESANVEIARYLLSCKGKNSISEDDKSDRTQSLDIAIQQGCSELVTLLLKAGAQVIQGGRHSLLTTASGKGNSDVVKAILAESVAEVNFVPENGESALIAASCSGFCEIVKMLLDSGADVDLKSKSAKFPLLCAVEGQHVDVVRLLLDRGACVNKKSREGFTPLMEATGRKTPKIAILKMLLDCADVEVDVYSELGFGHSALLGAIRSGSLEIVQLLLDHGADVDLGVKRTPLQVAVKLQRKEIAVVLLKNGASVDLKDECGNTAVISAMYPESSYIVKGDYTCKDMVELLLEWKANPNIQDCDGCSALMHAVKRHRYDCCAVLLKSGADPKLVSYDGQSPEQILKMEYASRVREEPLETDLIRITEILDRKKRGSQMKDDLFSQLTTPPKRVCREFDRRVNPVPLVHELQQVPVGLGACNSHQQGTPNPQQQGVPNLRQQVSPKQNTSQSVLIKSEDVPFLMEHLHQYSYKWREIGTALGFLYGELENIQHSKRGENVQRLLTTLLSEWAQWPTKDHHTTPTFEKLCECLRSGQVGLGALATQLEPYKNSLPSRLHSTE